MNFIKTNVRKSIKKLAFSDPKGEFAKSLLCYLLVVSLLHYGIISCAKGYGYVIDNYLINCLISLIIFSITSPLFLNLMNMYLQNSKDELFSFKDLFTIKKIHFKFLFYFFIIIFSYFCINYILGLLPIIGIIINFILIIIFTPSLFFMPYIFIEESNLTLKEIIYKSLAIVKGQRIQLYGMILSFSLWFLLGLFTFGILYFWLIPYLLISLTYLYLNIKGEKEFNKEKCLGNGFIIILFCISIIIINIISFITIPNSFNEFKESLGIVNTKNTITSLTYGGKTIYISVPNDYKKLTGNKFTKTYTKGSNILQYSLYLSKVDKIIKMDKDITQEKQKDYNVTSNDFVIKIGKKNIKGYMYTLEKNNEKLNIVNAYYPKENLVITISLTSNHDLKYNDIKKYINVS